MAGSSSRARKAPKPLTTTQRVGLVAAVAVFFIPFVVEFQGLSTEGHRVLGVLFMAVVLWVTEAIPLHATTTIIILSEILLVSTQGLLPVSEGFAPPSHKVFFATLADPILMLFLGGFVLADCAAKFDLDRNLAGVLLRPFGNRPGFIMLGLMLITAVFSMFMSNTATTATMMAVVIPVVSRFPAGDRMRIGLVLCIPIAANIGGMGTPIGTPPNAIAIGALARAGISVSFLDWMLMVGPFMIVILLASWLLMSRVFSSKQQDVEMNIDSAFNTSRPAKIFYVTFIVTILLWLTGGLHGVSSSVCGFLPVAVLLSTRVFSTNDLQSIQWQVLWLVAGGIALGVGVGQTGLDKWLVGLVGWENLGVSLLVAVLVAMALVFSTFISNTATTNLLVPLAMSLASSGTAGISAIVAAALVAMGASLAMSLPVSTPPNAIAMSTGTVRTKDMALVGIFVGLLGGGLCVFGARWFWGLLGVTS